jgi:hypothetical protein
MYKVITHTIKEEHYGHPMSAEVGIAKHANTSPHTGNITTHALTAGNEIMLRPSSVEFRMNLRSLFSRFFWRVRDYLISVLDSRESSDVEIELYKNIDAIGAFIDAIYGPTIANEFNNSLKDVIKNLIFVVKDIRSGKDFMDTKNKLSESIRTFANFLNRINTTQWPYSAVVDIFSDLTNNWIIQISSRKIKDWVEDMRMVDKNEDIMLSGDVARGAPSFAEIFAKGIIAQNQQRFM